VTAAVTASDKLGDKDAAKFGDAGTGTGLYLLAQADLFNLLCIPPDSLGGSLPNALHAIAAKYCVDRRALYIVDPPSTWTGVDKVVPDDLHIGGTDARNAALYFPRVLEANPLHGSQPETFVACGAIAGIMARTDVSRGVWKAPAGIDASLTGVLGLSVPLNDAQNGLLNPLGVNCLRSFPIIGNIVWGARTMRGADMLGDEYKYVPVRRLALYIEESLFRGLKWVVFEPNDEPLWGQIRLNVGAFMHDLFRQGAFQGTSARDAYFVKSDKDTTTQSDINLGIVNVVVGFAPLKPAEFVVLKIQQMAGQIQT
jgi:phage tail sheath protein FI